MVLMELLYPFEMVLQFRRALQMPSSGCDLPMHMHDSLIDTVQHDLLWGRWRQIGVSPPMLAALDLLNATAFLRCFAIGDLAWHGCIAHRVATCRAYLRVCLLPSWTMPIRSKWRQRSWLSLAVC